MLLWWVWDKFLSSLTQWRDANLVGISLFFYFQCFRITSLALGQTLPPYKRTILKGKTDQEQNTKARTLCIVYTALHTSPKFIEASYGNNNCFICFNEQDNKNTLLEQEKDRIQTYKAVLIQKTLRGWLQRRKFCEMKTSCVIIQAAWRGCSQWKKHGVSGTESFLISARRYCFIKISCIRYVCLWCYYALFCGGCMIVNVFSIPMFLAATKQLYEWSSPSVCLSVRPSVRPSVTPFWLCSHHRIIMKFSGVVTNDKSDVHAKG